MWDVLALFAAGFVCLVAFVVRTVRADVRAGRSTDPDVSGWLLVAGALLFIGGGAVWGWLRLFSS